MRHSTHLARRLGTIAFLGAAVALVGCGSDPGATTSRTPAVTPSASVAPTDSSASPTPSAVPTPTAVATPTPPPGGAPLSDEAVQAVVQRVYPVTGAGFSGGCASTACPFTARLSAQLAHLTSQTPSPTHPGDVCNYDLLTGNNSGLATPVVATVQLTATGAEAIVDGRGQSQPSVTLLVIDSGGTPLVDDIVYDTNHGRSVYSLNCTGL